MAESTTSGLSSSMTLFATAALAPGALRLGDGVMMHVLPPRAVVRMLEGPRAGELLTRGTGLDDASLVPGSCTRTRLAQLPVFVRSLTPERIKLLVDRGPAAWLREWFIDAGGLL